MRMSIAILGFLALSCILGLKDGQLVAEASTTLAERWEKASTTLGERWERFGARGDPASTTLKEKWEQFVAKVESSTFSPTKAAATSTSSTSGASVTTIATSKRTRKPSRSGASVTTIAAGSQSSTTVPATSATKQPVFSTPAAESSTISPANEDSTSKRTRKPSKSGASATTAADSQSSTAASATTQAPESSTISPKKEVGNSNRTRTPSRSGASVTTIAADSQSSTAVPATSATKQPVFSTAEPTPAPESCRDEPVCASIREFGYRDCQSDFVSTVCQLSCGNCPRAESATVSPTKEIDTSKRTRKPSRPGASVTTIAADSQSSTVVSATKQPVFFTVQPTPAPESSTISPTKEVAKGQKDKKTRTPSRSGASVTTIAAESCRDGPTCASIWELGYRDCQRDFVATACQLSCGNCPRAGLEQPTTSMVTQLQTTTSSTTRGTSLHSSTSGASVSTIDAGSQSSNAASVTSAVQQPVVAKVNSTQVPGI